jgi:putative redox protein
MAKLTVTYDGGKRISARRREHVLLSDQPEKSGGSDTALPPFDIFVSAHAMCMLLFAQMFLERNGLSTEGLALDVDFEMDERHRRLAKVAAKLRVPNADLGKREQAVIRAALACPVHHSLREDVDISLELAR